MNVGCRACTHLLSGMVRANMTPYMFHPGRDASRSTKRAAGITRGLHNRGMAFRYGLTKLSRADFARIARAMVGVSQSRVHIHGAPDENMKIRLMENRNPLKYHDSPKCPDLDTATSAACAPPAAA